MNLADISWRQWIPHAVFAGLALMILAPLLLPGYIFALDMIFAPDMPLPSDMRPSWLFYALFRGFEYVLPADVLQKIILFFTLFAAGLGAFRLSQVMSDKPIAAYMAGLFFVCNPFVYDRFMVGQFAVLMGYALLPWFARLVFMFVQNPTLQLSVGLAALSVLCAVLSVHTLVLLMIVGICSLVVGIWRSKKRFTIIKQTMLSICLFLIGSSFWLTPLLMGMSSIGAQVNSFGLADTAAFATLGDSALGKLAHIVRLQGFWAEDKPLYVLPQEVFMGWGIVVLAVLSLVIAGSVHVWRTSRRWMLGVLVGMGIAAIFLAVGIVHIPGLREPQKAVALLALSHAVLGGLGAAWLVAQIGDKFRHVSTGLLCVLALLFTPNFLWAANGQLAATPYPPDWYAAKAFFANHSQSQILVLPWHQYLFVDFAGRTIRNPADFFFGPQAIVSDDPEFSELPPAGNQRAAYVREIVLPAYNNVGAKLKEQNIDYVLLLKVADYEEYAYLDQADLLLISDTQTLQIYKVVEDNS